MREAKGLWLPCSVFFPFLLIECCMRGEGKREGANDHPNPSHSHQTPSRAATH